MASDKIDRQHAATVRRLLQSESAALTLIKAPVSAATSRVQAQVGQEATTNPRRSVLTAIRHHGGQLQSETRSAVLGARQFARKLGRDQLESDLLPLRRWALRNLQASPPLIDSPAHAAELDVFEADRVASALHTAWGSALMSGLVKWERKGESGSLTKALAVDRLLSGRLDRHAATQAASAYADERQSYWDNLAEKIAPPEFPPGGAENDTERKGYGPALFHVWSAVLDRRTCEDCAALDGATVPIDGEFEAGATTPLHPNCRCVILTTFNEDELDGTDNRIAVGDQVRSTTLPSLMRKF